MFLTDTTQLDRRTELGKQIGVIENIRGRADRWRAIQKLMFDIHPELRNEDLIHQEAVKVKRLEQRSVTGSSKSGSIRSLYSMPDYLYRALQVMDPEFQKLQSGNDAPSTKKFNYAIWSAFPEYRVCERI